MLALEPTGILKIMVVRRDTKLRSCEIVEVRRCEVARVRRVRRELKDNYK